MKRISLLLIIVASVVTASAQNQSMRSVSLGLIKLEAGLTSAGAPQYSVSYNGKEIIHPSVLGFILSGNDSLLSGFKIEHVDLDSANNVWQPVWGEVSNIRNRYKQITFHFLHDRSSRKLDIIFKVFEDGIAFRYNFPKQSNLNYFVVTDERSEFNLGADPKTFWIPGDYDTNEYPYTISKLSEIDNKQLVDKSTDIAVRVAPDQYAVQTPLMMKSKEGVYINIHEAALLDYPAMQLHVNTHLLNLTSSLVPDPVGNKAYLHAPFQTPWRTIIISNNAADILSSKMVLNLNEPTKFVNTSWIKPMKFVGVWWEMQTGKGTWSYSSAADNKDASGNLLPSGKHSGNSLNVKKYIDFAAANNIKGVLVEGWNEGWEDWFGNWKENVFDFVTPYPDFDVHGLHKYAADRGVQLIMHNETSGSATNYERQMDTAFKFMKNNGYNSVKTGYVGKIIPRGEHHDGQWMVNHYIRVAQKAADYKIMIDVHEPMRPTGIQRTFPNWMASEAGRGNEYNAFSIGNRPDHETILPFTRLIGGPMDYTPGIFKLKNYSSDTSKRVHTTLAKQLALYVTLYSPLQMVADLPENYNAHKDAFQFIRDVPVDWQDTKILEAEPGEYLTIARKDKNSNNWFIGAITNQNSRMADLDFSFLDKDMKYKATIYADADNADWKTNPEAYKIRTVEVGHLTHLSVKLANGGGMAVSIVPTEPIAKK